MNVGVPAGAPRATAGIAKDTPPLRRYNVDMLQPTDILRVLARRAADPTADLSTASLARTSGWSPAHFHRAFVRTVHDTPKRWSTRLRLVRAIERLTDPHDIRAIEAIAIDSGFSDHAQLSRVMRRALDTTPSAIRGMGGGEHVRHALCFTLFHMSLEPRRPAMSAAVDVQERPAQPIVFQRRTVPADQIQAALAECLPAVFIHCQKAGLTMAGPPFTRYIDMSRGTFTLEAGIPVVSAQGDDAAGILAGELPGGPTAVTVHKGPYETLDKAHIAVENFAREAAREPTGGPWESYLTDPGEVPDPNDWLTEVCLPLA